MNLLSPYIEYTVAGIPISMDKLESFIYSCSIDSRPEYTSLSVIDPYYDITENYVNLDGNKIVFRYGWSDGNISNKKESFVTQTSSLMKSDTSHLRIDSCDYTVLMNRGSRNKSYLDMASEVVKKICIDNSLSYDVEDTSGKFLFIQPWVSDMEFMNLFLRGKSISKASGRSDYDIYLSEGKVLHYHTPKYTGKIRGEYTFKETKDVASGTIIEIINISANEISSQHGGISHTRIGYDYHRKRRIIETFDEDRYLDRIVSQNKVAKDSLKLPKQAKYNRVSLTSSDSDNLVQYEAKTRFGHSDRSRMLIYIKLVGDPSIIPGDLISVVIPKSFLNSGLYGSSGTYLVYSCTNTITSSKTSKSYQYITEILGIRSGSMVGGEDIQGKEINYSTKVNYPYVEKKIQRLS